MYKDFLASGEKKETHKSRREKVKTKVSYLHSSALTDMREGTFEGMIRWEVLVLHTS